jgi:hypothetical protein
MTESHPLVVAYLRRLDAATADLLPEVREDLYADVSGHLDQAQRDAVDEADLRTRIDRLGPPEAIASEARGGAQPAATGPPGRHGSSSSRRDGLTVVLLVFGTILGGIVLFPIAPIGAVLGWATGVVLLWTSPSWRPGEKVLGTLVWPGGIALPLLLALAGGETCMSVVEVVDGVEVLSERTCQGFSLPPWLGIPVMIATFVAPILVAAVLLRRADRRRALSSSPRVASR